MRRRARNHAVFDFLEASMVPYSLLAAPSRIAIHAYTLLYDKDD